MSSSADTATEGVCPTCGEGFVDKRAMKVHHKRAHGESIAEQNIETCDQCGDEFIVSPGSTGTYCSRQCAGKAKRDRVQLECPTCEQKFTVRRSDAENGRKYCSNKCKGGPNSKYQKRRCEQCNRIYKPSQPEQRHCCRQCSAESRIDRPRPKNYRMLLWLLYVYEDYSMTATHRRQRAIIGHTECLTKDECKEILEGIGVNTANSVAYKTAVEADPDEFGDPIPDGDDSWQDYAVNGGESA